MSVMGKVVIPNLSRRNFVKIGAALQSVKSNNYFTYTQELSQPLDRQPERVTAEEAFKKCLKSGKFFAVIQILSPRIIGIKILTPKKVDYVEPLGHVYNFLHSALFFDNINV